MVYITNHLRADVIRPSSIKLKKNITSLSPVVVISPFVSDKRQNGDSKKKKGGPYHRKETTRMSGIHKE